MAAGEDAEQAVALLDVDGGKALGAHVVFLRGGSLDHALLREEQEVWPGGQVVGGTAGDEQRRFPVLQAGQHAGQQLTALTGLAFIQRADGQRVAVAAVCENEQRLVRLGGKEVARPPPSRSPRGRGAAFCGTAADTSA